MSDTQEPESPVATDARAYWPFYCEENTWLRCQALAPRCYAVFVTGVAGAVMMAAQRAGFGPGHELGWDYHVFTITARAGAARVHDPDHTGGEPVCVADYLARSFPPLHPAYRHHAPCFRAVPSGVFVETFASDRSHMRSADGVWIRPPPPWPAPGTGSGPPGETTPAVGTNLARFIDMDDDFIGERFDLAGLRDRFAAP